MANEDDKQVNNINEKEVSLIQQYFKGSDDILRIMRALFLNLGVSKEEKKIIKDTFSNPDLMAIMWKKFCPQLSKDTPIGQVADVWLGVEGMVFGFHEDQIKQAVEYKALSVVMIKKALALLQNPDGASIEVEYSPDMYRNDPLQINLLARNQYIRHVETQLSFLKVIANVNQATAKEIASRMKKDSTQ